MKDHDAIHIEETVIVEEIIKTNESKEEIIDVVEIIDIEVYAKAGREVPKGKHYRIMIDKEKYDLRVPGMTGLQLLELAHKSPPERWDIYQKFHGGRTKKIGHDEYADFTSPGVEKFMTLPLDQTEGYLGRRDFSLPELDEEFLRNLGLSRETVLENSVMRVVVYNFPIPAGYNMTTAAVNVRIERGYPDAQIDMVYFYPNLERADRKPIGGLATDQFDGKSWQRWSRHRTSQNPWRPGVDYLGTHFGQVTAWLEQEFRKR